MAILLSKFILIMCYLYSAIFSLRCHICFIIFLNIFIISLSLVINFDDFLYLLVYAFYFILQTLFIPCLFYMH